MRPIVLASTSPWRRAILDRLGLAYEAVAPDFEEAVDERVPPSETAVAFARGKALSVAGGFGDALVIGSDQVAELDERVLSKPGTPERAVEQLLALAGRTHRLWTAVALLDTSSGRLDHRLVVHQMRMRAITRAQALAYVERDDPSGCAGAYKVESLGIVLFEAMEGPDHTAIEGLPVSALADLFARAGEPLLDRLLG